MCVTPASVARVMLAATVLVPAHTTVAQTTQPKANERLVHALTFEIAVPSGADADTIVDDVIQVLRQRADPSGRHELQWRRVGHNRFEVRMPAAPAKVRQAERDYEQALDRLSGSINVDRLRALLALHVTRDERDRLPPAGVEARTQVIAEQLRWLKAEHPAVAAGIDEAARTHRLWQDQRTGLLDPRDLKQLVARNGVLEFRVAATKPKSSESGRAALTQARLAHYTERLEKHGPLGGERDDDFLWFPVRSAAVGLGPEIVTADYAGKTHVLLHNRNVHTMLQRVGADGKRPWSLTAFPASDQFGKPAVAFVLDARGAKQMALLSAAHKGNFWQSWWTTRSTPRRSSARPSTSAASSRADTPRTRSTSWSVSSAAAFSRRWSIPSPSANGRWPYPSPRGQCGGGTGMHGSWRR